MEPHFSKLLQSNEAPSQRTVSEIKHILQEPLSTLAANELEIQRLKKVIRVLETDQERIHNLIKPYKTILAPIRRLPADVLHEIFYHCLPSYRLPIMDASGAPLLLTHVCSSWRSLALSFPRLWAKITISLPNSPHTHPLDSRTEIEKLKIQEYERVASLRSDVIKTWLDRSGDCPLSISVMCVPKLYGDWDEWLLKMLENIVLHAQRWEFVELALPYRVYSELEASLANKTFTMLRSFKFKLKVAKSTRTPARRERPAPSFVFLNSPKLDTFSLSWGEITQKFTDIPSVWNQLRCLYLHSEVPTTYLISLFSQCSNLTDCRIRISYGVHEDDAINNPKIKKTKTISLPHLQTLIIHDTSFSYITAAVYRAIDAPALRCVGYTRSYSGSSRSYDANKDIFKNQLSSLCHLLETAPVEKLMLALAYQSSQSIVDILKTVSRPRHIILGQKPLPFLQAESTGSPRYLDTIYPQSLPSLNQFELDNLVTIADSSPLVVNLLPNLEILEAYGISHFSDDDALNMIKSRLNASKENYIAALKIIKLHFDRMMERDIREEINHYAQEVGASPVKLELLYEPADNRPKHIKPHSSSYGLSEKEGLSWSNVLEYDEFQ